MEFSDKTKSVLDQIFSAPLAVILDINTSERWKVQKQHSEIQTA